MHDEHHRSVAERAYRQWVEHGRPQAGAEEFWLQAEREVADEKATDAAEATKAVDNTLKDSFPASDPPSSSLPDEPPANADEKWKAAGISRDNAPAAAPGRK